MFSLEPRKRPWSTCCDATLFWFLLRFNVRFAVSGEFWTLFAKPLTSKLTSLICFKMQIFFGLPTFRFMGFSFSNFCDFDWADDSEWVVEANDGKFKDVLPQFGTYFCSSIGDLGFNLSQPRHLWISSAFTIVHLNENVSSFLWRTYSSLLTFCTSKYAVCCSIRLLILWWLLHRTKIVEWSLASHQRLRSFC